MALVSDDIDALPRLATPPTYSQVQVGEYYNHIGIPTHARHSSISSLSDDDQLQLLKLIFKRTLVSVPFENLSLHYSLQRYMTISPSSLFEKVVHGRCDDGTVLPGNRRGGYCMQNNLLFGTFLRSVGFRVTSTGARVMIGNSFTGWSHMNNIVRIANNEYMVDVGFGPNGPTIPMLLEHGHTAQHIAAAQQRLRYSRLPVHTNPESRTWIYEHRSAQDQPWEQVYCFNADVEFMREDYAIMNFATSNRRDTFFTYEIICSIFTADDASGEINGTLLLDTGLKKSTLGKFERIIERFQREDERLKALEDWFQITFPEEGAIAIKGMPSEIKNKS